MIFLSSVRLYFNPGPSRASLLVCFRPASAFGKAPQTTPPYVIASNEDWSGPPEKESHIRPVYLPEAADESPARRAYRLAARDATDWNHAFWLNRNRDFFAAREDFIRESLRRSRRRVDEKDGVPVEDGIPSGGVATPVTPEQMSVFYKDFLNVHREEHLTYMKGWYARNARVLFTAIRLVVDGWRRKLK